MFTIGNAKGKIRTHEVSSYPAIMYATVLNASGPAVVLNADADDISIIIWQLPKFDYYTHTNRQDADELLPPL